MKATTYYRIKMHPQGRNMLTEAVLFAAAMSNGGKFMTLKQLETIAEGIKLQYEHYSGVTIAPIGEHILHIDFKVSGEWINALCIEEIEILEMDENTILETKQEEE